MSHTAIPSLIRASAALTLALWLLPAAAKTLQIVNVRDYGAVCNGRNDDTAAFNAAIHAARQVLIPAGDCIVRNVILHDDTELFGVGDDSVLYVPIDAPWGISANPINGGSPDPATNMRSLHLHDFQMRGASEWAGFAEQRHLLNLNAVTGVLIENMLFRAFRGDGIYIGSSNTPGVERHNFTITIRDSRFDGVNKANRNAISAIDIDGLVVENNRFENMTQADMPGAVDLEPNANPFAIIRNVVIRNNEFFNIGGSNGAVALYVPAAVTREPQNIEIRGNRFARLSASAVMLYRKRAPTAEMAPHWIMIADNDVSECARPFSFYGVKGVSVVDNRFSDCNGAALAGYVGAPNAVRDITIENNEFRNSARNDAVCLMLYMADGVDIVGNQFQDCARGGPAAYAVAFNVGRSTGVTISGNTFVAPQGRLTHAVRVDPRHAQDADSSRFENNQSGQLLVDFKTAAPAMPFSVPRP